MPNLNPRADAIRRSLELASVQGHVYTSGNLQDRGEILGKVGPQLAETMASMTMIERGFMLESARKQATAYYEKHGPKTGPVTKKNMYDRQRKIVESHPRAY